MQVKLTKAALAAYADDLYARGHDNEANGLKALLPMFNGFLTKQMMAFLDVARKAHYRALSGEATSERTIGTILAPLERLSTLMSALSTADRRKDLQRLSTFLRAHESANITTVVHAVQSARRGPTKRPTMTLAELKALLEPSLGDDSAFKSILAELKRLSEDQFADVAKTALQVPFKNKKEGLTRLQRLHASTRTKRMKEAAATSKSAA